MKDDYVKSPIGLRPRFVYENDRRIEIHEAIDRYMSYGEIIPLEWIQEYNEITMHINKRD